MLAQELEPDGVLELASLEVEIAIDVVCEDPGAAT